MDTKLTVDEIELAIVNSTLFNKRRDIIVPNVSWGLLNHEADMVIMTPSGYLTEIEIKRSWEDFKADFKKGHKHDDERISKLYYSVPESIQGDVIQFLNEKFDNWLNIPCGVLSFTDRGSKACIKDCPPSRGRKLFLEEQLTIARLGCLRIWNLKQKLIDHEQRSNF